MPRCLRLVNVALRAPRPPAAVAGSSTRSLLEKASSTTQVLSPNATSAFKPSLLPSLRPLLQSSPSSVLPSSLLNPWFRSALSNPLSSPVPLLSQTLSPTSQFQQLRFKARGTEYQPSQRVRKRRHGFLARKKTPGGRSILVRRREKGRRFLSH